MGSGSKQNFFLVGAQKSGTTTLQKVLSHHKEIFVAPNETNFLEDPWFSDKSFSKLDELLNSSSRPIRGIKRPNLLFIPEVAERIFNYDANAKIVIALRDPVDRFVSAYFHHMSYGTIPFAPLNTGVKRILDGVYRNRWPISNTILEYGFYGKAIQLYREYFKAEQMLVLDYGDLSNDLSKVKCELSIFFQLPDGWVYRSEGTHENTGLRSPIKIMLSRLAKQQTQVYEPKTGVVYMRPDGAKSTRLLKTIRKLEKISPSTGIWKVDLRDDVLASLRDVYRSDQVLLKELIGRSFL